MVDFPQETSCLGQLQEELQADKIVGTDGGDDSTESRELRIQLLLGQLVAIMICSVISSVFTLLEVERQRQREQRIRQETASSSHSIGQRLVSAML
jgi:heme exporter protein D